jgi:hypothetical protein
MKNIPGKETLVLLLLIVLTLSINNLRLKNQYVQYIAVHPIFRFFIIFLMALLLFSFDLGGTYSIMIRITVAAVVAFIVEVFITANVTLMVLQPPERINNVA